MSLTFLLFRRSQIVALETLSLFASSALERDLEAMISFRISRPLMFITSALLYISSVLLSSVFLKLTFLFFTGIFQLTPPSLPLAYPPPPSPIHAAPIRPKSAKKTRQPCTALTPYTITPPQTPLKRRVWRFIMAKVSTYHPTAKAHRTPLKRLYG